jgi:hypothetical protein
MDWQYTLIDIFEFVSHRFEQGIWTCAQRFSNNHRPAFTDEEITTIYLYRRSPAVGIIRGQFTVKKIYEYTRDHLLEWFPQLPSADTRRYQSFNHRLNRLESVFECLIHPPVPGGQILTQAERQTLVESVKLIDSLPLVLAHQHRSGTARVARELADKLPGTGSGVL